MTRPPSEGNFRAPERWNSVLVPDRVARRAYENVTPDLNSCRLSSYSVGSHGYAQIGWTENKKTHMVLAHRAAWVHVNGQVPLGMTLDHLCKNRRCVNPDHLRLLPNYENARRTSGRDWPIGTCANGHDATHLVKQKNGRSACGYSLVCGTCRRESQLRWAAANPDKRREANRSYRERKRDRIRRGESS